MWKKILLLRTDRIGDMLITTPCFRALRRAYPQARLDVVASELNQIAIEGNPDIDNIYVYKRQPWTWPGLIFALRANKYDAAIAFNGGSGSCCRLLSFLNIPERITYRPRKGFEKLFTRLLPSNGHEHVMLNMLAGLQGLNIAEAPPELVFQVQPQHIAKARELFPRVAGRLRLALFVGNIKKTENRWPVAKFAELAQALLSEPDLDLVFFGGESDRPLFKDLQAFEQNPRVSFFTGQTFQESGAFLMQCDGLVCGSSGPTHLAAALGVPVLAVITRYNVRCWRTLGPEDVYVTTPEDSKDMRGIAVQDVLGMVLDFVAKKRSAGF